MTNDQIESAATDHASKYPEHLKTDIVHHYGLGIVRGLKEGREELAAKDKEIAELKATIERMAARLQEMAADYNNLQEQADTWKEESGN